MPIFLVIMLTFALFSGIFQNEMMHDFFFGISSSFKPESTLLFTLGVYIVYTLCVAFFLIECRNLSKKFIQSGK